MIRYRRESVRHNDLTLRHNDRTNTHQFVGAPSGPDIYITTEQGVIITLEGGLQNFTIEGS